jgi:hypothetical protein
LIRETGLTSVAGHKEHTIMADAGSVLTGAGVAALSWVALNFFGKPILSLREKRREALEVAERYAYVGLHSTPNEEYQNRALAALCDAGNSLRAYGRESSLGTRIYCWVLAYDLDFAARAMFGLGEAVRGIYGFDERTRRLTLHALFVALDSTHHLSPCEVAAAQAEMKNWRDGNRDITTGA